MSSMWLGLGWLREAIYGRGNIIHVTIDFGEVESCVGL